MFPHFHADIALTNENIVAREISELLFLGVRAHSRSNLARFRFWVSSAPVEALHVNRDRLSFKE